jgi:hypothetical protein
MPLILKGLLILAKSRSGRKLLITASLAALELAQSPQARKAFAKLRRT